MTRLQRAWTRMNPLWLFGVFLFCLWFVTGCAHDRCRADGKLPPDATFDELRDLKREQCQ